LACSECSDIFHGSLEAWWVVILVGICSVLGETVVFRIGFAVVHLMMYLAVKCWDTINTWVTGRSLSSLSEFVVWCSWGNSIVVMHVMSCLAGNVMTYYISKQVETGLVRRFGSWITGFNGRDPTAWVNG
jgi:membrane protein YqaA with SNARE-associated domain